MSFLLVIFDNVDCKRFKQFCSSIDSPIPVKLKFPFLSQVGFTKNKMGQEAMGHTVYKRYLLILVEQLQ